MNRREVLASAGAAVTLAELGVAQDAEAASREISTLLREGYIWCAGAIAQPLSEDKKNKGIADAASQVSAGDKQDFLNDQHAAFLKEFKVASGVSAAEIHIFAYTRYRLYVNGAYVGRGPNRFENKRPEYDTWPIDRFLKRGVNRIAVLVHRDSPTGRTMYHQPGMTALVTFKDRAGAHRRLSGADWSARPEASFRSRRLAWASIEETIDARLTDDWLNPSYDFRHWPKAISVAGDLFPAPAPRTIPLLRETVLSWDAPLAQETLRAGDEHRLALKDITLAYHKLEFVADAGTRLEVVYELPEGQTSGRSFYTARDGRQVWEGGDCFAFSTLHIKVTEGSARLTGAEAVQVLYPFDRVGRFTSSDPLLDAVWALGARSLEVMSEDAYVDCTDRERVEWIDNTPPAFECTQVMMTGPGPRGPVYSDPRLLKALILRIGLTQGADGQIKAHSCSERWDIHAIMEDRSLAWVNALRQYYEATADVDFIRAQWPIVRRLMRWFLDRRTPRGLVLAREWEVWDNPLRYQVCEGAGLNALAYKALVDAASLARRLGETTDLLELERAANDLAAAFNAVLWSDADGAYRGGFFGEGSEFRTQLNRKMFAGPLQDGFYRPTLQAALLALDAGVVPADRQQRLRQWIVAHQSEAKLCMSHHYLFKALYGLDSASGDTRVLELIREKWRPMTESPWRTAWEGLDNWGGSKLHIYGIVPAYFLSAFVLGVRLKGDVLARRLVIEPRIGDLDHAAAWS